MVNATALDGVDAVAYLVNVKEPNMHALAQVAFAEALLGINSGWSKFSSHKSKEPIR